ncbi:TIGR04222 domain-containing membrane protein [Methylosinus sp. H3A]|uniref:TIGR04222 domain-containing membrane protein n=1 Tax=Methylosinus sp. H3A TaxID=2785786 RepID=UPI0018C2EFF4|nr:TIGR04222 domain-containing membrane protein [Methylosinus sp. H3A]MBG0808550.1 TIGR04222 domain-containing membrane protein [Methylosinus sp. H3A]
MAGFSILGLSGPAFLGVYAGAVAVTLLLAHLFIRASDPTRGLRPPKVPSEPDAIALAYLSGGVNNVIRTLLFDLRQRGYVGIGADGRLEPAAGPPSGRVLDARPARVLAALQARPTPEELFADWTLAADLERLCAPERRRLAEEDLLAPVEVERVARATLIAGSLVLLGLAVVKLLLAVASGRENVIFLIFLAIVAEALLWQVVSRAHKRIASARGAAYLAAIKRAYGRRLSEQLGKAGGSCSAGATAFDAGSLFLVSVFGYEALKGALEPEFMGLFKKSASDSSGSCGSSSSCSGGDGGGGCGGCGGGGD